MGKSVKKLDADVVIAGGGPGGCTVAKELSRRGKKVVLLEKGGYDTRFFGHTLGTMLHLETAFNSDLLKRTVEGDIVVQGVGVGGGTLTMAGSAFMPDADYWSKYGINIEEHLDEAIAECGVRKIPKGFIGPGNMRLMEVAQELGYPWAPMYKFIDLAKHKRGCMDCTKGCPRGARWTAKAFADEAVEYGARVLPHVTVKDVMVEDGTAGGVNAMGPRGQRYEINSKAVVCSAGAIGTACILKKSGLHDAGSWFAGDPTVMSFGFVNSGKGNIAELPMATGFHDKENGVIFGSVLNTRLLWGLTMIAEEPRSVFRNIHRYGKALGIFAKITDDMDGYVSLDGKVNKRWTARDVWRMEYGRVTNERILTRAGCDPYNLHHTRINMGHPSATAGVGKLVNSNLETSIKNLYCCDTSVFPEAPGVPPALTVVCLGKMLSRQLQTIV